MWVSFSVCTFNAAEGVDFYILLQQYDGNKGYSDSVCAAALRHKIERSLDNERLSYRFEENVLIA